MKVKEYKCSHCLNRFYGGGVDREGNWVNPEYCPLCGEKDTLIVLGDRQVN